MKHRGERIQTNVTVRFFTRPSTIGAGCVTNLSPTGAFMETRSALRLLSVIYLEPVEPSPAGRGAGRIAATVVRCADTGVGLEWCEFGAETTPAYTLLAHGPDPAEGHQLPLPAMPDARCRSEEARACTPN